MSKQTTSFLFVYGSLRKDFDHPMSEFLQSHAQVMGEAIFQGKLFDLGSYPGAVPSKISTYTVLGDVYKLNASSFLMPQLDEYEGFDPDNPSQSLFIRKEVQVTLSTKQSVTAWIYLYNRSVEGLQTIPEGDYLQYLQHKK